MRIQLAVSVRVLRCQRCVNSDGRAIAHAEIRSELFAVGISQADWYDLDGIGRVTSGCRLGDCLQSDAGDACLEGGLHVRKETRDAFRRHAEAIAITQRRDDCAEHLEIELLGLCAVVLGAVDRHCARIADEILHHRHVPECVLRPEAHHARCLPDEHERVSQAVAVVEAHDGWLAVGRHVVEPMHFSSRVKAGSARTKPEADALIERRHPFGLWRRAALSACIDHGLSARLSHSVE
mmetsp:Transcript_70825/g.140376  ORF Transcript_70825/g.140376 Transcript_70825/m.140376 type:complete len:237 (-) Transcript_70825:50-760(-)